MQLADLEFIRKDAVENPQNKARYLRLIFDLLEASANTVIYESASSLTALTNNPVAVKAAASKFIELSIKESDNNVKLIVLDKVDQLRQKNEGVLDDLTMEILRVLSSPDLDVRRKAPRPCHGDGVEQKRGRSRDASEEGALKDRGRAVRKGLCNLISSTSLS